MRKIYSRRWIALVVGGAGLAFTFQNCGPGFQSIERASNLVRDSAGAPELVLTDNSMAERLPDSFFDAFADTRIFQREADEKANVVLSAQASQPAPPQDVYRVIRTLNEAGDILASLPVESAPFSVKVNVRDSTGMSYHRVRVSYFDAGGNETRRWQSPRFAVGEVFIVAGQSNAATHGQVRQSSIVDMNRMIDPVANRWSELRDPMPLATNWSLAEFGSQAEPGGSPWPAFADSLSQDLKVPVAVVSVAYGGTSVLQWQKGNAKALYPRLMQATTAVSGCSFRAILWHQGESDSLEATSAATYTARINSLIQNFKADSGCAAQPWIIAQGAWVPVDLFQPSYPNLTQANINTVASAQRALWLVEGIKQGPNTDQWIAAPTLRFDRLHFSPMGLTMHGRAWRDSVRAAFSI